MCYTDVEFLMWRHKAGSPWHSAEFLFSTNQGSYSVKDWWISPINNPIPLIPDNNIYATIKEIPWKILKLSTENSENLGIDGRTDRRAPEGKS